LPLCSTRAVGEKIGKGRREESTLAIPATAQTKARKERPARYASLLGKGQGKEKKKASLPERPRRPEPGKGKWGKKAATYSLFYFNFSSLRESGVRGGGGRKKGNGPDTSHPNPLRAKKIKKRKDGEKSRLSYAPHPLSLLRRRGRRQKRKKRTRPKRCVFLLSLLLYGREGGKEIAESAEPNSQFSTSISLGPKKRGKEGRGGRRRRSRSLSSTLRPPPSEARGGERGEEASFFR